MTFTTVAHKLSNTYPNMHSERMASVRRAAAGKRKLAYNDPLVAETALICELVSHENIWPDAFSHARGEL